MTKLDKTVEKFLKKPKTIKYRDIEKILLFFGFEKIKTKGSHIKFKHPLAQNDLIIPVHNGECKEFYKQKVKNEIKKIK